MTEYVVIDRLEDAIEAARALAEGYGPVEVDVERASGFRYSQRAYLIQVFRRGAGVFGRPRRAVVRHLLSAVVCP